MRRSASIAVVKPGATTGDMVPRSRITLNRSAFVVRDFCGHGVGRLFHDEPNILHYGRARESVVLKLDVFCDRTDDNLGGRM